MKETRKTKEKSLKLTTLAFTLIELLAVIVILAIIALIAVPIILSIIDNTKKSSMDRSKEMYLDAVEQAISRKNLTSSFNPSTCTVKSNGNLNCDIGELIVEIKGQKPCGGDIKFKDGKIISNKLDFCSGLIDDENQNNVIGKAVTESNKTLAGNIPKGNFDLGDEYMINVDGTNEYHFYILSMEGDKVNLIMSNNICNDGSLATSSNTCLVDWVSKEDYKDDINYGSNGNNNKGPITAINYLYEATKNWSNIKNINMNYVDEGNHYVLITNDNITTITMKDESVTATYENLKVRMPKLSEIIGTGCTGTIGSCPTWMVNGLKSYTDKYPTGTKDDIMEIEGYWSLSSNSSSSRYSWRVTNVGYVSLNTGYASDYNRGVRPVIEVLKSDLSN